MKKWQTEKREIGNQISNLSETTKNTMTRINILADFANQVPELYLKASLDEKRMILTTITESIVIDEEAQTIRAKLKPVFEHLRQLKLQDKRCFTAEIKNLNGTLKSRSDRAKQALNNEHSDVNELEDYRTRKKLLNTKIESCFEDSIKYNVGDGTFHSRRREYEIRAVRMMMQS